MTTSRKGSPKRESRSFGAQFIHDYTQMGNTNHTNVTRELIQNSYRVQKYRISLLTTVRLRNCPYEAMRSGTNLQTFQSNLMLLPSWLRNVSFQPGVPELFYTTCRPWRWRNEVSSIKCHQTTWHYRRGENSSCTAPWKELRLDGYDAVQSIANMASRLSPVVHTAVRQWRLQLNSWTKPSSQKFSTVTRLWPQKPGNRVQLSVEAKDFSRL
jgi:hypothetical protein